MLQGGRREWRISSQSGVPAKLPLFNRTHELKQLDSVCMNEPVDILMVLGPRSCGKTATMASYFAGKQNAVYIDCRAVDASTPTSFVYALLELLLPKIPREMHQVALEMLAKLPKMALRLAAGVKITEKMGGTASEEIAVSLADLIKTLYEKAPNAAQAEDLNEVFKVLGCACSCILCLHLPWFECPCCMWLCPQLFVCGCSGCNICHSSSCFTDQSLKLLVASACCHGSRVEHLAR
jgi:hypothetical protein